MKYLLDINTLIALLNAQHIHHGKASEWYVKNRGGCGFLTCSITELGFVRNSVQGGYVPDIPTAQFALAALKQSGGFKLLPDYLGADSLPKYVTKAKDTTDGHLLALAKRHGAKLATLDTGIPGAELIK